MKIAITLLVRDEVDIIREWLEFHREKADMLVITDNGSVDGTRENIEAFARKYPDYPLTVIDEPAHDFAQNQWVDRMIVLAREYGADWIANSDADEFWHCDFRQLAATAPANVAQIRVLSRLYVPTAKDCPEAESVQQRLPWRVERPRNETERACMAAWHKIFHRAQGWKANVLGNHAAVFEDKNFAKISEAPAPSHIKHYPNRTWYQYRRKYIQGGEAYTRSPLPPAFGFHWRERYAEYCRGGIAALKKRWYSEIAHEFGALEKD
ncbi:MAG: glycosyltransferase family 2 protein [Dehalococcoidia bacterium]|jgi:glycosyltransferase involved in cell wall biosynthesis